LVAAAGRGLCLLVAAAGRGLCLLVAAAGRGLCRGVTAEWGPAGAHGDVPARAARRGRGRPRGGIVGRGGRRARGEQRRARGRRRGRVCGGGGRGHGGAAAAPDRGRAGHGGPRGVGRDAAHAAPPARPQHPCAGLVPRRPARVLGPGGGGGGGAGPPAAGGAGRLRQREARVQARAPAAGTGPARLLPTTQRLARIASARETDLRLARSHGSHAACPDPPRECAVSRRAASVRCRTGPRVWWAAPGRECGVAPPR
jgi:hypothetical protein